MAKFIFEFQSYKEYLRQKIESEPNKGRGVRSKLAYFLKTQPTFISQVLEGEAHFNLEHGEKISRYFSHTEEEAHFLFLLIGHARSGTVELREYYQKQMRSEITKRLAIKNRLEAEEQPLSLAEQMQYYSSWHYGAFRVATTIPTLQSREALAQYFHLPSARVNEVIEFLLSRGLLNENTNKRLITTKNHVHLGHDSGLIAKFHSNWRLRSLSALESVRSTDIHFSSALTMSEEDQRKLQSIIVDFIADLQKRVRDSKEERLVSFCLDYFEL